MAAGKVFYISVGNVDSEMVQARWSSFTRDIYMAIGNYNIAGIYGAWFSLPDAAFQSACWCVAQLSDIMDPVNPGRDKGPQLLTLRKRLFSLAKKYDQESIVWAEAEITIIGPAPSPSTEED